MLVAAMLRERWTALLGTFVALCLGVALFAMSALTLASAVPRIPQRYAAAAVLIGGPDTSAGDGTFTESKPWSPEAASALTERLARLPGVTSAVAERSFYAQAVLNGHPVGDPDAGDPLGHGWSSAALAPYPLVSGRPPTADREVVLDAGLGLAPGAAVTLLTASGPARYTVSGTIDADAFFVTDAAAAPLAGGVRVIGLTTAPGADVAAIREAAQAIVGAGGRVLTGDDRAELEPRSDARTRWIGLQVLTGSTLLAGFMSIFVVATTSAFGVAQRRRELGLLRTLGGTPRQLRRILFGEAFAVGTAAAGSGALLGALLAPVFGRILIGIGFQPRTFTITWQLWPLAGSVVAGLVVAFTGVWAASRRAARIRPLEALREAEVDRRAMTLPRWIAGSALTLAGVALAIAIGSAGAEEIVNNSLYAAMALILGLTLLAPAVIPPIARGLLGPFGRLRGAATMLVRENVLTAIRRTASTAAPVLVTAGFALLIAGMVQTTTEANGLRRASAVDAVSVLTTEGTPGLSDAALAGVPGVAPLPTTLYLPEGAPSEGAVDAIPAAGLAPDAFRRLDLPRTTPPGGEAMVVTESTARQRNWRSGGTVTVTFEDGSSTGLRVLAVVPDGAAPAPVLLDRDSVRRHDPSALTGTTYLTGPVTRPIRTELGALVSDVSGLAASADAEEDRLVWAATLILIVVSAGYGALAIVNTLLMATAGRIRDFVVLRRSGATTRQVLRMVALESTLVVAVGSGLGMIVALTTLLGIRSGLAEIFDRPVALQVPWPMILGILAGCVLLATAASVLPARRALRSPPLG